MKVLSFEKAKESWQLDADAKLEQARLFKDKGTKHFKNSKYEIAASRYQKIIDFLEHEISLKGGQDLILDLSLRSCFRRRRGRKKVFAASRTTQPCSVPSQVWKLDGGKILTTLHAD